MKKRNVSLKHFARPLLAVLILVSLLTSSFGHTRSYAADSETIVPVYRLYNETSREHLYTVNTRERDICINAGWRYEGIGWYAPQTSNWPVCRLYHRGTGYHLYSQNPAEINGLKAKGWILEGVAFYSSQSKAVEIRRQFYAPMHLHNYTYNPAEIRQLEASGWKIEGTAWYGARPGDGSGNIPTPDQPDQPQTETPQTEAPQTETEAPQPETNPFKPWEPDNSDPDSSVPYSDRTTVYLNDLNWSTYFNDIITYNIARDSKGNIYGITYSYVLSPKPGIKVISLENSRITANVRSRSYVMCNYNEETAAFTLTDMTGEQAEQYKDYFKNIEKTGYTVNKPLRGYERTIGGTSGDTSFSYTAPAFNIVSFIEKKPENAGTLITVPSIASFDMSISYLSGILTYTTE